MLENSSSHFMSEEELFLKHPLPWIQHTFEIADANNNTVIHLGGSRFTAASILCTLGRFIVATANQHKQPHKCPRCGIGFDTDGDGDCVVCGGKSETEVEKIKEIYAKR